MRRRYEPISEAIEEGVRNFWPTRKRLRNWLILISLIALIIMIAAIFSLILAAV